MAGERILVVDDDRTTAKVIELQLLKMGYAVVSIAKSGPEAIDKTKSYTPDLLLMDIKLGKEMDGIEAAKIISQEYKVPIIYLTAHSDDDILARALETKPFGYVNKPLRESDLRTTISLAFDRIKTMESAGDDGKEDDSWKIKITSDREGILSELTPAIKEQLEILNLNSVNEILPDDYVKHVKACLKNNKALLIRTKYENRMFALEYSPNKKKHKADITIIDITAEDSPVDSNLQRQILLETLDHLTTGIIFINENLRIYYSNRSAEKIFASDSGILRNDDYLTCQDPTLTAELHKNVLAGSDKLLTIETEDKLKPIHVLITPLQSYQEYYGHNLPIAILFIFEAMDNPERMEDIIRSLYNLSPTEAKVAARLVLNPNLTKVAASLGITHNTARTHLKRIYTKTKTNRLSLLVQLIVTGPVGTILHTDG